MAIGTSLRYVVDTALTVAVDTSNPRGRVPPLHPLNAGEVIIFECCPLDLDEG